jgi:hypothetical protein
MWLLYVPWHFPLHEDPSITGASPKAEKAFAKGYPAVYEHLKQFKSELAGRNVEETGIRYEWYALQRWGSGYWQEFNYPKVIFGRFMDKPTYAFDDTGFFHNDALYFASRVTPFAVAVLNSPVNWWFLTHTCTDLANGFLQGLRQYQEQIPIPAATAEQRRQCERLAEALIWLHSPAGAKKTGDAPVGLMVAYFEQWLNGLVYELFFPGELHARKLTLFDATAKLNPPDLSKVPERQKLARLQELHAVAEKSALAGILEELRKVEEVRIIEEAGKQPTAPKLEEANAS